MISGSHLERLYYLRTRINDEIRMEEAKTRTQPRAAAAKAVRSGSTLPTEQRIADLGVTARQIKQWAVDQGLIREVKRGRIKADLVDAYENAHPTTTEEQAS